MAGDEDDVLSQVRNALEELDIGSPESRDALVDGVREALGKVAENIQDALPPKGKPDLHVVSDDDLDDVEVEPKVTVRWVSADDIPVDGSGTISVPGDTEDPTEAWQTVLHASEPRPYRISVTQGVLEIVADDAPISRLRPGQTTDVEAHSIRVRGIGGAARGSYLRM